MIIFFSERHYLRFFSVLSAIKFRYLVVEHLLFREDVVVLGEHGTQVSLVAARLEAGQTQSQTYAHNSSYHSANVHNM